MHTALDLIGIFAFGISGALMAIHRDFDVAGTVKALDHGLAPVAAVSLGVTTAVGGGLLRDVIARETPALVRPDSELYAVPAVAVAVAGAAAVAVAWELGAYGPLLGAVAAVAVFGFRGFALRRHWHGPRAWRT